MHRSPPWARRLAGLATALAGLVTVASSLSPNAPARQRLLEGFEPDAAQAVAHVLGAVGGVVLLWLAIGVLQGRRPAGRAAVAVLGVLAIVHAAKGLDYEEALMGLAVAAGVSRVLARGDGRPSRLLLAGLLALVALSGAFTVRLGGIHLLIAGAIGALAVGLRALLAPARARDGHGEAEHARAADLVARYGDDSIAPFLLRADKAFHFAHGGVLAYRALRETAVVSGDPVGPPGSAGPIMASFLEEARRRAWDVVQLGAADAHLDAYARLGLRTLQVGLEAVVDVASHSLEGRACRTVRKAVHRVQRHGWTIEVIGGGQLDASLTEELTAVEAAWRRTRRRLYGFAMAGDRLWGAPEDASDVDAIARNPAGEVRAFQRYVRYRDGFSLDATRRLDDEPNGIADSLVAAVLAHAREAGVSEVSLNFAGFGHLMAADTLERRSHRLARWALRRFHGRFQLERLSRAAEKFRPQWRARHLVYTAPTRLPLAAVRVLQAEAYIKPPRRRVSRDAWLPAPMPLAPGALAARPVTTGRLAASRR